MLAHLQISQVCAPCPPLVDTAPVRHWHHNCRSLKDKAGLSHNVNLIHTHTHTTKTVNQKKLNKKVRADRLIDEFCSSSRSGGLLQKPQIPFQSLIAQRSKSVLKEVLDQRFAVSHWKKETNSTSLSQSTHAQQTGSWSLIYSSSYCVF